MVVSSCCPQRCAPPSRRTPSATCVGPTIDILAASPVRCARPQQTIGWVELRWSFASVRPHVMASDGPSAGTATGGDGSPQDKPETSSGAPPSEAHAAGGTGGGEEGGDWHFIEIPTTESGGGTLRIAYLEAGRTAADADGSGDGASAGEGERPLVVCVHGYPDTARTWTDLLPRLAAAGFWAVAYNQRGYHPSGSPTDDDYDALRVSRRSDIARRPL